jgi:5-methylcytosine-specific restriction endonuclease McrA
MRNYRQSPENIEAIRSYTRERSNKNHKITKIEWESCKKYFDNKSAYCGFDDQEHKKLYNQQLHKEHVIHNGENDLSNCVPSCKHCNSQKWEFTLEEWYNEGNPSYTKERYDKIIKWLKEDYKQFPSKRKNKHK